MPLYHNDDQAMLKASVAPFVAEQAPVDADAAQRDGPTLRVPAAHDQACDARLPAR